MSVDEEYRLSPNLFLQTDAINAVYNNMIREICFTHQTAAKKMEITQVLEMIDCYYYDRNTFY